MGRMDTQLSSLLIQISITYYITQFCSRVASLRLTALNLHARLANRLNELLNGCGINGLRMALVSVTQTNTLIKLKLGWRE
jgi:hypothetical protein